jgi:hypothetical protein
LSAALYSTNSVVDFANSLALPAFHIILAVWADSCSDATNNRKTIVFRIIYTGFDGYNYTMQLNYKY